MSEAWRRVASSNIASTSGRASAPDGDWTWVWREPDIRDIVTDDGARLATMQGRGQRRREAGVKRRTVAQLQRIFLTGAGAEDISALCTGGVGRGRFVRAPFTFAHTKD